MTIAEVARLAGVSTRTVERDVAAGVLPAKKTTKGPIRILARDARVYRCRSQLRQRHWKPAGYARAIGVSVGLVRRWIKVGTIGR